MGKIHSFQSLGTVDGPGVRYVVFFQGCHLRCKCCHNPDTWNPAEGKEQSAEEIVRKVLRFKEYFGKQGGITLSGGEPLLQADFAREIFVLCHRHGIHTCLDTSGGILNESVKALLSETDRVLLDIKYTNDADYRENAGCGMQTPLDFLSYLNEKKIPTTIRQVIIPTVNDDEENILKLKEIVRIHTCVDKVELLPFRKICQTKYDNMKLHFPFGNLPACPKETVDQLYQILNQGEQK
ncbi:MAG: pyruvate formate lyase-activating protein [Clostridia bacterium]|nr:pyruvate formate lyase-activating protein [Clostridia bacterium]